MVAHADASPPHLGRPRVDESGGGGSNSSSSSSDGDYNYDDNYDDDCDKMRFGKTLRDAVYAPWKDKYIDYTKLKALLHEDKVDDDGAVPWTEDDEKQFCDEIFNVQLEKVAQFQQERVDDLKQRVDAAFDKLKELAPTPTATEGEGEGGEGAPAPPPKSDVSTASLRELEKELDDITNEVKELKKYSSINYTGFLKIVKKHDRKRGDRYRVRPMMQLSLAQRPFNSEQGYSPLLNKLSIMYYAIRQQLEGGDQAPPDLESQGETHNCERYTAHKCMSPWKPPCPRAVITNATDCSLGAPG